MINKCHIGDCRVVMRDMIAASVKVQCVVTSPPYWGLRDYGIEPSVWGGLKDCAHEWGAKISINKGGPTGDTSGLTNRGANQARNAVKIIAAGQFCRCGAWLGTLGLEPDYRMYIDHMVEVMELVWEVLADDGTLWLNLGDSYATGAGGVRDHPGGGLQGDHWKGRGRPKRADGSGGHVNVGPQTQPNRMPQVGLKPKDLCLMPARVAIALQEAGWWVRQDIIWNKPNPMPESVNDRCTKAHEYIFLLSKSKRYYYDFNAMQEPVTGTANARGDGVNPKSQTKVSGWAEGTGSHSAIEHAKAPKDAGRSEQGLRDSTKFGRGAGWRNKQNASFSGAVNELVDKRNRRSVWTIQSEAFADAHFATFPRRLVEPCILAGSRPGDIVFDPFMGSGTTAQVAEHLGRQWIGCELNPDYLALQRQRLQQQSLPLESAP